MKTRATQRLQRIQQIKNNMLGVTAIDGIAMVSSRDVADMFEKRHDNVLQSIANCGCSKEFNLLNFKETLYKDNQGRKQREVLMTKDRFAFIVMGFTGRKAAIW
ncbi:antirepressor [Sporomusaceae bacterium FL31]|nr:antirepressor [Sporomusaceae bacterium FL31]GCE34825.1 antirepressor [Sporomusaceae bacterium]